MLSDSLIQELLNSALEPVMEKALREKVKRQNKPYSNSKSVILLRVRHFEPLPIGLRQI